MLNLFMNLPLIAYQECAEKPNQGLASTSLIKSAKRRPSPAGNFPRQRHIPQIVHRHRLLLFLTPSAQATKKFTNTPPPPVICNQLYDWAGGAQIADYSQYGTVIGCANDLQQIIVWVSNTLMSPAGWFCKRMTATDFLTIAI